MIQALAGLLLFQLAGELISRLAAIPVPGPGIGMVLLVVYLSLRGKVSTEMHAVS